MKNIYFHENSNIIKPCRGKPEDPKEKHHLVYPRRGMDERMSVFKEQLESGAVGRVKNVVLV